MTSQQFNGRAIIKTTTKFDPGIANEVKLYGQLSHPNLVFCHGISQFEGKWIFLEKNKQKN